MNQKHYAPDDPPNMFIEEDHGLMHTGYKDTNTSPGLL